VAIGYAGSRTHIPEGIFARFGLREGFDESDLEKLPIFDPGAVTSFSLQRPPRIGDKKECDAEIVV
jgi:hypothetical protein